MEIWEGGNVFVCTLSKKGVRWNPREGEGEGEKDVEGEREGGREPL